jgi:hypothetical protein
MLRTLLGQPFSGRQKRLAESRPAMCEADFVSSIEQRNGDGQAARAIWQKLRDWCYDPSFAPGPEDDLEYVFGIAEEELDEDIILDIFKALRLEVPGEAEVKAFGDVDTPLRIAQLVAQSRGRSAFK